MKLENFNGEYDMSLYHIINDDVLDGFSHSPFKIMCLSESVTGSLLSFREIRVTDCIDDTVMVVKYAITDSSTTLVIKDLVIAPVYKRMGMCNLFIESVKKKYDIVYFKYVYNTLIEKILLDREFSIFNERRSNLPKSMWRVISSKDSLKDKEDDYKYYERGFGIKDMYWTSIPSFRESLVDISPVSAEGFIADYMGNQKPNIKVKDSGTLPVTGIEFFMGGRGNPLTKDLKKKSRFAELIDLLRGKK